VDTTVSPSTGCLTLSIFYLHRSIIDEYSKYVQSFLFAEGDSPVQGIRHPPDGAGGLGEAGEANLARPMKPSEALKRPR